MKHRVVVTGVGTVNPLGTCTAASWQNLLSGCNGVRNLLDLPEWSHLHPEISKLSSKLAAPVTEIPPETCGRARMKLPRHFRFAEMAASETLKDSNLQDLRDVGVFLGCGMPGVSEIYEAASSSNLSKLSPYFIPAILGNSPAGHIFKKFGFRGPVHAPSLACATGAFAIGEAVRFLRGENDCKAILAGACEAPLNPLAFAGFSNLRALSTLNSSPAKASRPFDLERNGFVLGEGAGCLLLERLDSALKRNAPNIYAEIIGYANYNDSYHPTAPDPSSIGAIKAINLALKESNDFNLVAINAHATSTKLGDEIELAALQNCIDPKKEISVISNKGAIGHLLGASGAVESIFTVLSLKNNILPANRNLKEKIPTPFNLPTTNQLIPESFDSNSSILKTSFGFGGVNVALHFKKYSG